MLDGYVARLNKTRQSRIGADLDSLSDVISFGVAPAVLGFTLGLRGGWDMLVLTYFIVCGVSRLARFNVTADALADSETGKVKLLRRDADSDQHRHRCRARSRILLRTRWRGRLARFNSPRTRHPALLVIDICGQRKRDDQRDPADSKAIDAGPVGPMPPSVIPSASV